MSDSVAGKGSADPRVVTVRGKADGWVQNISVGRYHFLADEPISSGGTDTGPTPYDFILAALGA